MFAEADADAYCATGRACGVFLVEEGTHVFWSVISFLNRIFVMLTSQLLNRVSCSENISFRSSRVDEPRSVYFLLYMTLFQRSARYTVPVIELWNTAGLDRYLLNITTQVGLSELRGTGRHTRAMHPKHRWCVARVAFCLEPFRWWLWESLQL